MLRDLSDRIRTTGQKTYPSAEDGRIELPLPDGVRPDHQFEAAKAKPVRLTGSA